MEIEQRYVISFLHRKSLKANEITEILEKTYGSGAYKIDAVRYWLREITLGRTNFHENETYSKGKDNEITIAIQCMIEKDPLSSARHIARTLGISPTTVIDRLHNDLHMKCYLTRWVPHHLSLEQKKNRLDISKEMLQVLRNEQRTHFHNVITGDESWFLFEYVQGSQWVLSKEDLITKTRKTNMQKKIMLSIFFNSLGPVVIDFLPSGTKFNGEYFIGILSKIDDAVYPLGRPIGSLKKLLHFDNSPCHKAKKVKSYLDNSEFRTMKHPAYSPDVAPSDFGLFGTVKNKLIGTSHNDENELKEHITEILMSFDQKFWQSLFDAWIMRLEKLIEKKGDYFE